MLSLLDGSDRIHRRELLTIGSLAGGGLSLSSLLAAEAAAGQSPSPVSGKSVIFLFQQGGPSQLETFDPKLEAPAEIRSVNGSVRTNLAGVHFGGTMERLARLASELAIVRSFQTNNGGHNIQPIVGPDSLETNIGTHYSRLVGTTRPGAGIPTNAVLFPSAVADDVPGPQARGNLAATGSYGDAYAPFIPGAGGQLQQNMQLSLPRGRFDDRRLLLGRLDRLQRQLDSGGQLETAGELRRQAYELLLGGGIAQALDLSQEDPRTVARYDTSAYVRPDGWDKVNRGKKGYYTAQAQTIGKLLLLARRLCEAGCGFVTIHAGYAGVWDMHADGNNLNMRDGMEAIGRATDHAVAAFVEDVRARGLDERILLVATGEMGRTPRLNRRGGRDHWSRLAPLLLFGGGIRGGQVIGRSTRDGGEPASDNLTPKHLIATILRTVFDLGQLRLASGVPPEILRLSQQAPIPAEGVG